MGFFVELVKWFVLANAVAHFAEAIYRIATEKDYYRRWKNRAIEKLIDFIVCMILFLGLALGW